MKKPQNIEEAKALLWKLIDAMARKRREHTKAERDYLTAKEWVAELEAIQAARR